MPRSTVLAPEHHGAAPERSRFQTGAMPQISVIEGMAGVGKTALALHAARTVSGEYPDGTYYLNLHTHDPGTRRSTRRRRWTACSGC